MKRLIMFSIFLCVLALVLNVHLQARGYALLQSGKGQSGYHYSYIDTDVFTYSDSLNEVMIPSGFTRNYYLNVDGEITQSNATFTINHTINNLPDGIQFVYECFNNENVPYYNITICYDNYGRLIYKFDDHDYIRKFWRFINPETGLNDSLIMRLNTPTPYIKCTYDYDSLNRVSTRYIFSSSDSLNWSLTEYSNFDYGSTLPFNLSIYEPETLSYDYLYYFVDEQYTITSQTITLISTGNTDTLSYYIASSNPFTFHVGNYAPPDIFRFNNNGRLIYFSYSFYPSTVYFMYNWGDYTDNEDEVSTLKVLSVYPNPFKSLTGTTIKLYGNDTIYNGLSIYNLKGQLVKTYSTADIRQNNRQVLWKGEDNAGKNVSSGVYLIKLQTQNKIIMRKMLLVR